MARQRHFTGEDVLTAARARLHHIFDLHDTVAVCFSGGKDSLVALHLTHEVARERGATKPLHVVFRDEELIPQAVIDFVDGYRQLEWIDMRWYCVPLWSQKFILGRVFDYVQWDPQREHVRPMPAWGITDPPPPGRAPHVYSQYDMDTFAAATLPGKVAFVNGIRASESLMRFRASVNKLNDSYINASADKRVTLCKPLYDWQENDIFKYLGESSIRWCELYDSQHYARQNLRVSSPLHQEAAKIIGSLRTVDPEFYDRVLNVFPEMAAQDRYWGQLDRDGLKRRWGSTYAGVREYIDTQIVDPSQRQKALTKYESLMVRARRAPDQYPPDYVFTYIYTGAFKRELMGLKKEPA